MASVLLPSTPNPAAERPSLIDFGGSLQGPLGGAGQRLNRLGNRWALQVEMPFMTMADALVWSAALTQARRLGARFPLSQVGVPVGSPGAPLVNGAGQSGTSLIADGFSASYSATAGQFFSVITDSQRYLYMIGGDSAADGTGAATLTIEPLLRQPPADNDVLEFGQPYIEGHLSESPGWSLEPAELAQGFTFTIEEVR